MQVFSDILSYINGFLQVTTMALKSRSDIIFAFKLCIVGNQLLELRMPCGNKRDTRRLCWGLSAITDYKPKVGSIAGNNGSLPDELNAFYTRFELTSPVSGPPVSTVTVADATCPGGDHSRVLRTRADQLAEVFTDISSLSRLHSKVPTTFRETTTLVPKKGKVACLNDCCPEALTSTIMMCFERMVMAYLKFSLPSSLDPLPLLTVSTGPQSQLSGP